MRGATLRDLNIRWYYWLIPSIFGIASVTAMLALKSEREDRFALITCGLFSGTLALLAVLWPVLRLREKHGVRFCSLRFAGEQIQGVFVPASSVKAWLLLLGGAVFGLAGLGLAIGADTMEHKVKGWIAFLFYSAFATLWCRGLLVRKPGILLSQQGILWHEVLLVPCLVPWEQISAARVYQHREKYSTTPTFGLQLQDLGRFSVGHRTKAKLVDNFNRHGWHLYYHAESLLAPLGIVESMVGHYRQHGAARCELATGAALNHFTNLEE